MPEEELKPGEGTPAPASGDKPEDQPEGQPEGQKPEGQPTDVGTSNQEEELKKQIAELTKTVDKQAKKLEQAGFNIENYKAKLKEAGLEDEETGGISEEKVREIMAEENKPILEQLQQFGTTLSEIARSNTAKKTVIQPGAGAAGQKPSPKKQRPTLSPTDEKILANAGISWSAKDESFVNQKGEKVNIEDVPGVVRE